MLVKISYVWMYVIKVKNKFDIDENNRNREDGEKFLSFIFGLDLGLGN